MTEVLSFRYLCSIVMETYYLLGLLCTVIEISVLPKKIDDLGDVGDLHELQDVLKYNSTHTS